MKKKPRKEPTIPGYILETPTGGFVAMFAERKEALEHKRYLWEAHGKRVGMRTADLTWNRNDKQKTL